MMKIFGLITLVFSVDLVKCPDGNEGMQTTADTIVAACKAGEGFPQTGTAMLAALGPAQTLLAAKLANAPADGDTDAQKATKAAAIGAAGTTFWTTAGVATTYTCANVNCIMKELDACTSEDNYFRDPQYKADASALCAGLVELWPLVGQAATCTDSDGHKLNCVYTAEPTAAPAPTDESGNSAVSLSAALALFAPLM